MKIRRGLDDKLPTLPALEKVKLLEIRIIHLVQNIRS